MHPRKKQKMWAQMHCRKKQQKMNWNSSENERVHVSSDVSANVSSDAFEEETGNVSSDASRVWAQMHLPARKECELWINLPEQGWGSYYFGQSNIFTNLGVFLYFDIKSIPMSFELICQNTARLTPQGPSRGNIFTIYQSLSGFLISQYQIALKDASTYS